MDTTRAGTYYRVQVKNRSGTWSPIDHAWWENAERAHTEFMNDDLRPDYDQHGWYEERFDPLLRIHVRFPLEVATVKVTVEIL